MKPEISIIVPIYNAEDYLPRCIDSILEQTFTNFELIMVNDGSTDQSGEICDQYALKDNRIKIIHIENGGVSNARNTGIRLARGKFLMFCDSDDYVENAWCKNLYCAIEKHKNAMPVSGIKIINEIDEKNTVHIKRFKHQEIVYKSKYFQVRKGSAFGSICNKIFSKEIILENGLNFNETLNRTEDHEFILSYMDYMEVYITIPSVDYIYVLSNENSLNIQYRKDLFFYTSNSYNLWKKYFDKHSVEIQERKECATYYFYSFKKAIQNTYDQRNPDNYFKKIQYNNHIINAKEFRECLELADLSKEDHRFIRLLKTRNYYLVWLFEKAVHAKKIFY